jgi:hypothetical protein
MTKRAICTRKTFCSALGALMIVWSMAQAAAAKDDVRVRFSYKLKGEYGLFYMGQAKGAYSDAGLTVRFGEGAGSQAALGGLLQDQDDLIVLPGIFAISAIQKGMPIKIIALYQPAAPAVLISQPENPVATPKDLEGKTLATPVGETGRPISTCFVKPTRSTVAELRRFRSTFRRAWRNFLPTTLMSSAPIRPTIYRRWRSAWARSSSCLTRSSTAWRCRVWRSSRATQA